jgi:hypothetical protein
MAQPDRKHIFNIDDIRTHCEGVIAATPAGEAPDFGSVWEVDWAGARENSNCTWLTVYVTDASGVKAPMRYRFSATQGSSVEPATAKGFAETNAWRASKRMDPMSEPRTQPPCVSVSYYETKAESANDDGFTPVLDAQGQPVLPAKINNLAFVAKCYNQWFYKTMTEALQSGRMAPYPTPGQGFLAQGQLGVKSTKICMPMQTHFGVKSRLAGKEMLNAIFRMKIKVDKNTGFVTRCQVYDRTKPFMRPDRTMAYEQLMGKDGMPFNNYNAHELLISGTKLVGVGKNDICLSALGISSPGECEFVVMEPGEPALPKADFGDVFTGGMAPSPEEMAAAAARAPPTEVPALAGGGAAPNGGHLALAGAPVTNGAPPPQQQYAAQAPPPQQQYAAQAAPPQQQYAAQAPPPQQYAAQAPPPQQQYAAQAPPPQQQYAAQQASIPEAAPVQPPVAVAAPAELQYVSQAAGPPQVGAGGAPPPQVAPAAAAAPQYAAGQAVAAQQYVPQSIAAGHPQVGVPFGVAPGPAAGSQLSADDAQAILNSFPQ